MSDVNDLVKQLEELRLLPRQLIIRNTPEAVRRLNEVRHATSWYGREIALQQDSDLGGQ
jgi:hypothetical protein